MATAESGEMVVMAMRAKERDAGLEYDQKMLEEMRRRNDLMEEKFEEASKDGELGKKNKRN